MLIGGAAINRNFGRRILYPNGQRVRGDLRARRLLLQGRVRGPARGRPARRRRRARALVEKIRDEAKTFREKGPEPEELPTDDDTVRSAARTDVPVPTPPFWGVREIDVDLDDVFPHLDLHVLFKLHWGGRGVKGEAWEKLLDEDFRPRLKRMWQEKDEYIQRAGGARLLPVQLATATSS